MSDASFTAAGYAIMIEDDPNQKLQSKRKTFAPVAFGSKTFNPTQTKMSIYVNEFLSIYFAFFEFGHFMWGSTFPVIAFTDNRSVTRFFQAQMIPPALWNACDYVLQCNFVVAHVAGSMNTAADFLSRTEIDPTEKLEMTIRNDIHTKAIEVNIESSGIVEEEQIYVLPDDEIDENQLWEEKQNVRNQAQTETHSEPENEVSELQQFHKPTSGLTSVSSGHFINNARFRLERKNDIVLRNLRTKIEGKSFNENELASDYRYQHYLQNITRIEIKQEVLTRKYYTDTGTTKNYYPCMAKCIKKWVSNCQICIQTKHINNDLLRTELRNCPEWDRGPEDILKMDILPNFPPSGEYNLIITAIDVFSRNLFAYPVTRITAASQSLPTPTNLKGDITVELALLHKYGIITTLPFSKYASPIFAQRKPNWRLRLLVDLRKINNLITEDYTNKNHPVSTLSDAAHNTWQGKNFSANWIAHRLTTAFRWQITNQFKCSRSILQAERLLIDALRKVSADHSLHFQAL